MPFKKNNPGCCCECELFRDDFTRADAADLGGAWDSGGWGVSGGKPVYDGTPSGRVAYYDTPIFGVTAQEQRDAILVRVKFEVVTGDEMFGVVIAADKLGDHLTIEFRGSGNGTSNCWQIQSIDAALPDNDKTLNNWLYAKFPRPTNSNGALLVGEYSMDVCFFPQAYPNLSHAAVVVRDPYGNILARSTGRDFAEGNYVGLEQRAGLFFDDPAINSFSVWTHKYDSAGFPVSANGQCPDCNVDLPCELNKLDAVGIADGTDVFVACDWSFNLFNVTSEQIVLQTSDIGLLVTSHVEDPHAAIDFGGTNGSPAHSIEVILDPASRGTTRLVARLIGFRGEHAWGDVTVSGSSIVFSVGDTVQGAISTSSVNNISHSIKATLCAVGNFVTLRVDNSPTSNGVVWGYSSAGTTLFSGQNGKTGGFYPLSIAPGDKVYVDSVRFLQHSTRKSGCQPCIGGDCVSCCASSTTPSSLIVSGLLLDVVAVSTQLCVWRFPTTAPGHIGSTVVDPTDPDNTVTNNTGNKSSLPSVSVAIGQSFIVSGSGSGFFDLLVAAAIGDCRIEAIASESQFIAGVTYFYQGHYVATPGVSSGNCAGQDFTLTLSTCLYSASNDPTVRGCTSSPLPATITVST